MALLFSVVDRDVLETCVGAAQHAGMDFETEISLSAFGSRLFRDPDYIGVLWTPGHVSAEQHVLRLRQGNVTSKLFVVLDVEGTDPDLRPTHMARILRAGADDVQPWPIDPRELAGRWRALERRGTYVDHQLVELPGGCTFDGVRGVLTGPHEPIRLTKSESRVLQTIIARRGACVAKDSLIATLYPNPDGEPEWRSLGIFIMRVRKRVMAATGGFDVIETMWGQGYRFVPEGFKPTRAATGKRAAGRA